MVAVCQQPNYFPWLGYFEQCARSDVFIVLDSVQWIRQGRQHRTRILPHASTQASDFQWLTLPVCGHGHRAKPLRELRLDPSSRWPEAHWKGLVAIYGKAPQFRTQFEPLLRPWFETVAPRYQTMLEASWGSVELCLNALELTPKILFSSALPEQGTKTERLISLCQATGADTYYSGLGSTPFVDVSLFRAAMIRLLWQHWRHPEYAQNRPAFRSHLSILDALAVVPLPQIRAWFEAQPWGPFARKDEVLQNIGGAPLA